MATTVVGYILEIHNVASQIDKAYSEVGVYLDWHLCSLPRVFQKGWSLKISCCTNRPNAWQLLFSGQPPKRPPNGLYNGLYNSLCNIWEGPKHVPKTDDGATGAYKSKAWAGGYGRPSGHSFGGTGRADGCQWI